MKCDRWQRLVALYVGDDLDRSRTARVAQHLAACPSCRNLEHDLRRDLEILRELDFAATAGLDLGSVRGAVMAKIESRPTRTPVFSQPRLVGALAAAVIVIALAFLFREAGGPDSRRTASRRAPSPTPELVAEPERVNSPLQPSGQVIVPAEPKTADTRLAHAASSPPRQTTSSPPSAPAEPMTIKILTDDPEVVIYWIVDPKGDKENV